MGLASLCSLVFVALTLGVQVGQGNPSTNDRRFGIWVREIAVRVKPADIQQWEGAVREIASSLKQSNSDEHEWLLYRSAPCEFWIVLFGDDLASVSKFDSYDCAFPGFEGDDGNRSALNRLVQTEFEVVRDIVCQKDNLWGTVEEMSVSTHPKARVPDYWVKPGKAKEFDEIQKEYVALLKAIGYPYPVEGFRPRIGAPHSAQVVLFPDAWSKFHDENDLAPKA